MQGDQATLGESASECTAEAATPGTVGSHSHRCLALPPGQTPPRVIRSASAMAGYSATGGGVGLLASAASTVVSSPGVSGGPASAAAAAPSASAAVWAQAGMDTAAGGGSTGKFANYKIISTIGRGNFGVCHLCECIDTNRSAPPRGQLERLRQPAGGERRYIR